ncbi:hypothetical protein RhiirC2_794158 [Rhizophagus irregularis]|uniref:RRM domain-containing protein n=1 Tax=Rhizophagus irregularis TaxID=588596 RepID=A0A2N1ME21_9GLOM|nr:hypothetical protein RhiirC2_794158 [Rhizophagus irregularis]
MGKSNKKKSSQQSIPVQEFVDSFTNSFASILGDIIFEYLYSGEIESEFYKAATAKLVPTGDIVTERSILDNVRVTKQFTRTLNQAIISGARCKARQTLDSLSSRYQNALPSLVQNAVEAQLKKKEKKVGKQKAPVSDDADANLVIDESMNIDDNVDPDTTESQPNQEGSSNVDQSSTSISKPIGSQIPKNVTSSESQITKGKITKLTINNNVIHNSQKGQMRTIMVYDIPAAWSHDAILEHLKSWGQVLEISFKTQHKYQSVWTKMILKPTIDTDFVMRTWQQNLGDSLVRWYPGHWKLRERKARERFQVKFSLPEDWKSNPLAFSYHDNKSFEHILSHELKGRAFIHLKVHGKRQLIAYFETHEHLLRCMEFSHHWKPTISTPPTKQKIPPKSDKDKKSYSRQSKGKNLGNSLNSSTRSRNKSNTQQKTDDTRSLLLKLLNLLV